MPLLLPLNQNDPFLLANKSEFGVQGKWVEIVKHLEQNRSAWQCLCEDPRRKISG